jgi:nickel superoxide dismutase
MARPGGKPALRQHRAMSGILVNRSSSPALPMFVPDGKELPMRTLRAILHPTRIASAHCDIPCGIYDPEQARIEAESCYKIIGMYQASDDDNFKARIVHVKEERAELVKHHLDVLWHDYFKPEHLQQYPNLHQTFWTATKQASTVRHSLDLDAARELLSMIDTIDEMWKGTGGLEKTRVNGRPC